MWLGVLTLEMPCLHELSESLQLDPGMHEASGITHALARQASAVLRGSGSWRSDVGSDGLWRSGFGSAPAAADDGFLGAAGAEQASPNLCFVGADVCRILARRIDPIVAFETPEPIVCKV